MSVRTPILIPTLMLCAVLAYASEPRAPHRTGRHLVAVLNDVPIVLGDFRWEESPSQDELGAIFVKFEMNGHVDYGQTDLDPAQVAERLRPGPVTARLFVDAAGNAQVHQRCHGEVHPPVRSPITGRWGVSAVLTWYTRIQEETQ